VGSDTGEQLRQCFELLTKIREEYPEGDFDREMIHGDMDFRYRQVKEDREKLEAFPKEVREFARLVDSLTAPEDATRKFFATVVQQPRHFAVMTSVPFQERQQRLGQWAKELGTAPRQVNELLSRIRLAGVLNPSYELNSEYVEVIHLYLKL
jgi:hypothetical protein